MESAGAARITEAAISPVSPTISARNGVTEADRGGPQAGLVGAVSNYYSLRFDPIGQTDVFHGIVAQAVLGTISVFAGMLIAYKTGIIKVTEKFRRIVVMAVMGYAIFALSE